jgi:predicted Co/Zn/Cd cation transporter (cation efflux family)
MTLESARAALSRPVFGDERQIAAVRFLSAVESYQDGTAERHEMTLDVIEAARKEGRTIRVEFEMKVPRFATASEIEEWLRFELHDNGSMDGDNRLADLSIEPIFGTLEWETRD